MVYYPRIKTNLKNQFQYKDEKINFLYENGNDGLDEPSGSAGVESTLCFIFF